MPESKINESGDSPFFEIGAIEIGTADINAALDIKRSMIDYSKPIIVEGFPQHDAWGKQGGNSIVAQMLGTYKEDQPYAELWFGTHVNGNASAIQGDIEIPLVAAIETSARDLLGERVCSKYGAQLPFLFKVLSVGEALSIQAHPTKEQAERLRAENPKLYKDDNHKPEVAIPITPLTLLYGFRSKKEIIRELTVTPEFSVLVGKEALDKFSLAEDGQESELALKALYKDLMQRPLTPDGATRLTAACESLINRLTLKGGNTDHERLVLQLADKYPTDIGLFAAYFMNLTTVEPGKALFIEPGIPHAYLHGDLIEVMANSDNVVRAGLTPKECDVNTLIDIVDCRMGACTLRNPTPNDGTAFVSFDIPVEEFDLALMSGAHSKEVLKTNGEMVFLFSLNGIGKVVSGTETYSLVPGKAIIIPAKISEVEISLNEGTLYKVVVP